MQVDYRHYNNPKVVFPAVAVTTFLLLGVFAMSGMNGAHRWIRIAGLTLQPSELAKPVLVLFLAYFLQTRIHQMDDWKGTVLKAAAPSLVFIALILKEPDLGHGAGVRGGDGADAVPGRGAVAVLCDCGGVRVVRCCITCCFMWRSGGRGWLRF